MAIYSVALLEQIKQNMNDVQSSKFIRDEQVEEMLCMTGECRATLSYASCDVLPIETFSGCPLTAHI